ncbi:MAG: NUDIX hydrolase [Parcubacteria group bacterium]|nr:NUDIX hydrolase [Parcubacteria group bacterium]
MNDQNNPYTTLSSRIVYKNQWMEVVEDAIEINGTRGIYSVLKKEDGVVIVPILEDGSMLLVGQWRYPVNRYSWELPMGGTEGEDPLASAKRELQEETNYQARAWKKVGFFYVADGHANQGMHVFEARDLFEAQGEGDERHQLSVERIGLEECTQMIERGEVFDGPTISGLYLFMLSQKDV